MTYFLIAGSVLCGWALLRCVGNERERQTRTLESQILAQQAAAAAAKNPPSPAAAAAAAAKPAAGGKH